VKQTAATLAAARARLTKAAVTISEARVGLYTTAGFACGTASAWVTWGVGAGLAGACASFLLMGVLSDGEKGAAR
jgi:L-serine deaminase